MSYDVAVVAAGREVASSNYTSNVAPMWRQALGGTSLGDLVEAHPLASELRPYVLAGALDMALHPEAYIALEPANGWGDYRGALDFLVWLADVCGEYPSATITVDR
jgi:hypothetical protein